MTTCPSSASHPTRAVMRESAVQMQISHQPSSASFGVNFLIKAIDPILGHFHSPTPDKKHHRWDPILDGVKMLKKPSLGWACTTSKYPNRVSYLLIGPDLQAGSNDPVFGNSDSPRCAD